MKKSPKVIKFLHEQYNINLSLGIVYMQLHLKAKSFGMSRFATYIKNLSDDKLTVHKDLIVNYLDSIQEDLPVAFEFKKYDISKIKDPKELARWLLNVEGEIRQHVNDGAKLFMNENDFETFDFWSWFVNDGLKDYSEVRAINDLFDLSKELLLIDYNISKIVKELEAKEDYDKK